MKNDNYVVFILDVLQQPVDVEVSDSDIVRIQEFLKYLRVTNTKRHHDVVKMLEEKYGINGKEKITVQNIAINHGINRGLASGLICELNKRGQVPFFE
ncbi:MAG: hypothetical protein U9Q12_02475 [Patescibacteria group bacterium]|nr:hypothetical protein [Patescibacteria group bacterium]